MLFFLSEGFESNVSVSVNNVNNEMREKERKEKKETFPSRGG
jgi:hypothetical protein